MLVFIDESGDPGMKGRLGTSEYFIVTAVIFEDDEEAESCDDMISEFRAEIGKRETFEFRFNTCCNDFRIRFLDSIKGCEFFYYSLILNKSKLWSVGFHDKESLYKYATSLVFENAKPLLRNATVIIDKCGDRQFKYRLSSYLKRKMNEPQNALIKKVKMEDSHSNNLLQLADMVCGAVARSFRKRSGEDRLCYRKIIRHREGRVQLWPK